MCQETHIRENICFFLRLCDLTNYVFYFPDFLFFFRGALTVGKMLGSSVTDIRGDQGKQATVSSGQGLEVYPE